ncbi:MAG: hypothetical protein V1772_11125 [Chloroflexota bacterium]
MIGRKLESMALCGAVLGSMAVAMELWGGLAWPHAYGFCTTCHGQDLVGWLGEHVLGVRLGGSLAGSDWPLMTGVGVVLGGWAAASLAGERRARPARHPWLSLGAGILTASLGLMALGCPIRQVILLGYGDWIAVPALIGHVAGVGLGTLLLKRLAERAPGSAARGSPPRGSRTRGSRAR